MTPYFVTLHLIDFDITSHCSKQPQTRKEIQILLKCLGSPCMVQLPGRTTDDKFEVFFRYPYNYFVASIMHRFIANICKWIPHTVDGIAYLLSLVLTHRNLLPRNFFYGDPVIIGDLGCPVQSGVQNLHRRTVEPQMLEVIPEHIFTPAADVYGLGVLLQHLCYAADRLFLVLDS